MTPYTLATRTIVLILLFMGSGTQTTSAQDNTPKWTALSGAVEALVIGESKGLARCGNIQEILAPDMPKN